MDEYNSGHHDDLRRENEGRWKNSWNSLASRQTRGRINILDHPEDRRLAVWLKAYELTQSKAMRKREFPWLMGKILKDKRKLDEWIRIYSDSNITHAAQFRWASITDPMAALDHLAEEPGPYCCGCEHLPNGAVREYSPTHHYGRRKGRGLYPERSHLIRVKKKTGYLFAKYPVFLFLDELISR